jgi:putative membrane protein
MKTKIIIIIVLLILLIIFVLQNTANIKVDLFFWNMDIPGALLLFICFALGVIIGLIIPASKSNKPEKEPDTEE